MRKLFVRADDLGYCESVNYGIHRAVKDGIVRSVGVMPNMEWAEHGVRLLDGLDVTFTVHSNICNGRPITDPGLIPSLVQENGEFKDKDVYRGAKEDFVVLEEVVMEVEAQYQRLVELTGKKPYCVEGHAVPSANFFRAMQIVAERHGVQYLRMTPDHKAMLGNTYLQLSMDSGNPGYNPFESLKKAALQEVGENECVMMVLHPGYVDEYVYETSYITRQRAQEVAMCIAPETKQWLEENRVHLLTYGEL